MLKDMESIKITVDSREPQHIIALLLEMGAEVERKTITPADYVLSSECAVERKTAGDFFSSLFCGRLFEQVSSLKEAYEKPIFILEGDIENQLRRRRNPIGIYDLGRASRIAFNLCHFIADELDKVEEA